jgi:hypothetical protein
MKKKVLKKKCIEKILTQAFRKADLGVSLFEMASGRFRQMRVVTSTTLTEIMEF